MRVVAIIASYNEGRFIGGCLEHLHAQGVEAYLIDNQSEDDTVEIARSHLGSGLLGIETLPRDGVYRWRQILRRKEELAATLDADWFLHLDPDEVPLPPRAGSTLVEALAEVDAAGCNAVDFAEYTFVPTRESPDHDHPAFRRTMHWYYSFAPAPVNRLIAWKRQSVGVDLATSGGHVVDFPHRRVFPERFGLRHYLFLSRAHAARKYGAKRYDPDEQRDGWHGWRPTLSEDRVRLPHQSELRIAHSDAELDSTSPFLRHCLEWPARRLDGERYPRSREASRPVVLCIVNRPDWAHDRKTQALERHLASEYRILRRYENEVSADDIEGADLVLLWFWLQFDHLGDLAPVLRGARERLVVGICSHYELDGPWRDPGVSFLAEVPAAVFANNRALVDTFEPLLGRRVAYAPNGVDTLYFNPAPERTPGPTMRVGWAGSLLNHGPGHRGVEEVISPGVALVPGAELCLAAREQRWRNQEEMRAFYQSLDVYVCASRSEGTPNPCFEAAACGLPVVTTRVGNMPELIVDGVNGLFIERDAQSLAGALHKLSGDPGLRARLGKAARRSIEAWDWRRRALTFAQLFDAVLDRTGAP
jgi:glycosyltransferase involved in cell wall biosynthesis